MTSTLKNLMRFGAVAAGFGAAMWALGFAVRPNLADRPLPYTPEQIAQAAAARDTSFDAARTPTLHYKEQVTPTEEPPLLAKLVADGKLPPLAERMPGNPPVMEGPEGPGKYGGTWLRLANSPSDIEIITYRLSGSSFMHWSPLGYPLEPHLAERVTHSPDMREWTVTLREGVRWSDGQPYTTDDVMYWWEHEANNRQVLAQPPAWTILGGKSVRIERIDRYRFKLIFDNPCPTMPERLVTRDMCDSPAHYLRKLHPTLGDQEYCEQLMRAYRQPSRTSLYNYMKQVWNPEHPRLWPWVYRTYKATPPQVFVRNPYYYAVDRQGRQLPYIDRIQVEVQDPKIMAVTAMSGGVSMQDRHIRFSDYTEMMSRRDSEGIDVLHWYNGCGSVWVINPNLNKRIDADDPVSKLKAEMLQEKKFRQALSLAIDRKEIIRADYYGVGEPSQMSPGRESPFYNAAAAKKYTEYDPARANRMLDELGLTQRDIDGFRTFRDGTRMVWYLDTTTFTGVGPAQFVVDDWGAVGIRCIARERNRGLFYAEKDSFSFDFNVWTGESEFMPLILARYFVPFNTESFYAAGWGKWYMRGGFYGNPLSQSKGSLPVPKDSPMYEAIECYEKALQTADRGEQKQLMDRVLDIAGENLWSINIATAPPQPVIVKRGFKNVPKNALYGVTWWTPANAGIECYFFETPVSSAGADQETQDAILQVTPRPGATAAGNQAKGAGGGAMQGILRWGILAIAVLAVGLVALRHPFIAQRLLIMVPTLLIVSVVVFSIIQLPPGDFLTTKIIQLQASGDTTDFNAIEDLRRMYHFEEPAWKQYLRWMGFRWFATFDSKDLGLLQGNLGRSMETNQLVNNIVGDRILMTIILSLGTIFFTWITALPIGIYSAVRQYSISDYALTVIGFLGMSVPSFLLALVLMVTVGLEPGLNSQRYVVQPEWDWPKIVDLLKHLVIPVVVIGVGGTAGMIRVMRANLLDELKKPYVTTAMAKGVRPMKLLIKYPVRLALNPFISGIGALFPQIVSGGAIVSMVLALPTVAPEMIRALLNEDIYLAGSMLMVLSVLGVVGTLVSDMLLLWLDPRIRFEGGTR